MSEKLRSRIRSVLKLVGMALVSFGIINIEESMGAQEALMSIIGAVTILIGLFWSEKDHKEGA